MSASIHIEDDDKSKDHDGGWQLEESATWRIKNQRSVPPCPWRIRHCDYCRHCSVDLVPSLSTCNIERTALPNRVAGLHSQGWSSIFQGVMIEQRPHLSAVGMIQGTGDIADLAHARDFSAFAVQRTSQARRGGSAYQNRSEENNTRYHIFPALSFRRAR
jgi:hypothetical protein